MAILWGSPVKSGTSELRVGVDFITTAESDSAVTIRVEYWVWTKYGVSDSANTFARSGSWGSASGSASISTSVSSGTGWSTSNQRKLAESTKTFTKSFGATSSASASCSLTGIEAVGASNKATASRSISIAARPYLVPAAPSGLSHVRNSDSRNTLSWTRNVSTEKPYASILVERSVNGAAFAQIAKLSGTATSYADSTTVANSTYRYRVRAQNSTGYSSYSAASTMTYNTPIAPRALTATLLSESSAELNWTSAAKTANRTDIERRIGATGDWVHLTWTSHGSYVDNNLPASGYVFYRVRHRYYQSDGSYNLISAYSGISNGVGSPVEEAPRVTVPLPPTLKATQSSVPSTNQSLRFAWTYNSTDGSAQSKYELEVDGVSYVVTGSAKYHDLALSTIGVGAKRWRVRTWGLHTSPSSWSAYLNFTVIEPPQASITLPAADGDTVTGLPLSLEWDYFDNYGTQASVTASIFDATGKALYVRKRAGAYQYMNFSTAALVLPDDSTFKVELRVRSSSSLESVTERTFATDYILPAVPSGFVDVDVDTHSASVTVHAGEDAEAPATVFLSVFRLEGERGTLVADNLQSGETVIDHVPPFGTPFTYRVVAFSNTGAAAESITEEHILDSRDFALNFGEGNAQIAKLRYNIEVSTTYSNDSRRVQFEGRTYPMLFSSNTRGEEVSLSGVLVDDESIAAFTTLANWAKRAYFRSPAGDAFSCSVEVQLDKYDYEVKRASVSLKIVRLEDAMD